MIRSRQCLTGDNSDCQGSSINSVICDAGPCPTWGEWSEYSPCSVTCGSGSRFRNRVCSSGNSADCPGEETQTVDCDEGTCPTWGEWGSFSACTVTCGSGTRTRSRPCLAGNREECIGDETESQACNDNPCPINGGYTEWTRYGDCTALCIGDLGERVRRRLCTDPEPQFGGLTCLEQGLGVDRESLPCEGTIPNQAINPDDECFRIGG